LIDIAIDKGIEEMKKESTDLINEIVQKVGEKIELGKVIELSGSVISYYVHNNKSGTIVSLSGGNKELARDIAMHISAMKPSYMNEKEITEEDKKKVLEVFQKEVDAIEDKSKDVKSKILAGKISTYFKEQTLLNQNFIKNPELSIERLLANNKAQIDSFIYESII
jgi:elongation factor Ts